MTNFYSKISFYRLNNKGRAKIFIDVIEFILALLSFPLAIYLTKLTIIPGLEVTIWNGLIFEIFILISWFVLSKLSGMAKVPRTQRYRTLLFELSRVVFITSVILVAVKYVLFLKSIPFLLIAVYATILFVLSAIFRVGFYKALKGYRAQGRSLHHVLVVADSFSDGIIERLIEQKEWGFKIHGIMTSSKLIRVKYGDRIRIYHETDNLKSILDNEVIDEVLYCRRKVNNDLAKGLAKLCNETGVIFRLQSSVSPIDPIDFQLRTVTDSDELTLIDAPSNNLAVILKNMSDIYLSVLALIMLSPVFLLLALLIKLDSKGPVFFLQERIGLRGRKFKVFKFRTMVTNAEELLAKLQANNEADGPVFKMKHDPRITKVGRFLRKTGLDELPQLINVVKGEMSLVGPRPPLEKEVKQYKRWQLKRLSVKPGITCTWQVVPERHDVSFEEWMHLDMGYIDHWHLGKDVGLFFKTVKTFFVAGGH